MMQQFIKENPKKASLLFVVLLNLCGILLFTFMVRNADYVDHNGLDTTFGYRQDFKQYLAESFIDFPADKPSFFERASVATTATVERILPFVLLTPQSISQWLFGGCDGLGCMYIIPLGNLFIIVVSLCLYLLFKRAFSNWAEGNRKLIVIIFSCFILNTGLFLSLSTAYSLTVMWQYNRYFNTLDAFTVQKGHYVPDNFSFSASHQMDSSGYGNIIGSKLKIESGADVTHWALFLYPTKDRYTYPILVEITKKQEKARELSNCIPLVNSSRVISNEVSQIGDATHMWCEFEMWSGRAEKKEKYYRIKDENYLIITFPEFSREEKDRAKEEAWKKDVLILYGVPIS